MHIPIPKTHYHALLSVLFTFINSIMFIFSVTAACNPLNSSSCNSNMTSSYTNISSDKRITTACNPSFTAGGPLPTDGIPLVEVTCNPNITADERLIVECHTLSVKSPVVPSSTFLTTYGTSNIPGIHSLPSQTSYSSGREQTLGSLLH